MKVTGLDYTPAGLTQVFITYEDIWAKKRSGSGSNINNKTDNIL
jgi:hypothetical protein